MVRLDSLPASKNINDVASMRRLQLSIEQHINALTALKVDSTGYGALLATRLLRKVPEQLQKKWFEDPKNKSTDLNAFITFLSEQLNALERFSRLKLLDDSQKPTQQAPQQQKEKQFSAPDISSTSALALLAREEIQEREDRTRDRGKTFLVRSVAHLNVTHRPSVLFQSRPEGEL